MSAADDGPLQSPQRRDLRRVLRNWRDERDSAALYEGLAALAVDSTQRDVFGKLASSEREHAAYWEARLREIGGSVPRFRPSLRTRALTFLSGRFGVGFVIPNVTIRELADQRKYSTQDDALAAGLVKGERHHAAVMRRIGAYGGAAAGKPGDDGPSNGKAVSSNSALSNTLRASVLGANDGIVSNFCLTAGVAGGGMAVGAILLTGLAGLVAGACSMALGEWLSVTNAREMARSQTDADARGLHATNAWRAQELALLYRAKGMAEQDAQRAAAETLARDSPAADLVEEERILDIAATGNNPAAAALYSSALFACGAAVPLLPFFIFSSATRCLLASASLALCALFVIGLITSFFNGRSAWFSGLRQTAIGALAAAVTYGAGGDPHSLFPELRDWSSQRGFPAPRLKYQWSAIL